jgi:hypothetical protein
MSTPWENCSLPGEISRVIIEELNAWCELAFKYCVLRVASDEIRNTKWFRYGFAYSIQASTQAASRITSDHKPNLQSLNLIEIQRLRLALVSEANIIHTKRLNVTLHLVLCQETLLLLREGFLT